MIIFTKKAMQFVLCNNECGSDSKKWHFLLKWMIIKKRMCDTKKNVTQNGCV